MIFFIYNERISFCCCLQMNAQVGDAKDRAVNLHEAMSELARICGVPENNPACNGQISIEPGVPEPPSIAFHVELNDSLELFLLLGFKRRFGLSVCAPSTLNPLPDL